MANDWNDVAISILSTAYGLVLMGSLAQCPECGMAYTDDMPLVDAGFICPSCNGFPLKRGLTLETLRPRSDFPDTFKRRT